MSEYKMDKPNEEKLKAEAEEYAKTYEFGLDKQDMKYRLQREGKEIPEDDTLSEMVKEQYIETRRREIYCEENGHDWKEANADPESGTSDLDCERCGEHHTLQWM